jgi:hypothetical protein
MKICNKIKEKLCINIIKIREPVEDGFIIWSKYYKLKKSDFNGQIRNLDMAQIATKKLIDADAKIVSIRQKRIYYKIIRFKITAISSRNHSWMNDEIVKYADLNKILHHEQGHFMVEEAFAMKLRRKLNDAVKNEISCELVESEDPKITVKREAWKFLDKKRIECQRATIAYQTEYDNYVHDERKNQVPERQKEYDEKITRMLES